VTLLNRLHLVALCVGEIAHDFSEGRARQRTTHSSARSTRTPAEPAHVLTLRRVWLLCRDGIDMRHRGHHAGRDNRGSTYTRCESNQ
jgi:hypothetical protein